MYNIPLENKILVFLVEKKIKFLSKKFQKSIHYRIYINTSPRGNTQQSTNYTATYLPSRKLSKLDEPDMQVTAGEAGTSSWEMHPYGPPHMTEQRQDDQLKHTYISSVRIRDVALKTCQRRWTVGRSGERESGISVLAARHDYIYIYIYVCVCVCVCVCGWVVVLQLSIPDKKNNKNTFYLYNFIRILTGFRTIILLLGWSW